MSSAVTCNLSPLWAVLEIGRRHLRLRLEKKTLAGPEPTTSVVTFHVLSFFTLCLKRVAYVWWRKKTYGFEGQRLSPTPLRPVVFNLLSAITLFIIPHIIHELKRVAYVCWREKKKGWRGANPRPMVLKASAFPLPHSDLLVHIHHIIEERRHNTTGRSGVVVGRWRSNP